MNRITYTFDIDDEFVDELTAYQSPATIVEESNELDAFDGAAAIKVITFIITSILSGGAYDIAKNILLKVKARLSSNPATFVVQLDKHEEAFVYAAGKFYRQTKNGKMEVAEDVWLDELFAKIDH